MDQQYFHYLAGDRNFYDSPDRGDVFGADRYELAADVDWTAWHQSITASWAMLSCGPALPPQGWKIHISATPASAQYAVTTASRYFHAAEVNFKFIPTEHELINRNGKRADRTASGKFITAYPRDERELQTVLEDLDPLLSDVSGPYILSDLRWASGPLYVRYGGFHHMTVVDERGNEVPAIVAPDGSLVPDVRDVAFLPPAWVELPPFLRNQVDLLGSPEAPEGFPFTICEAVTFSNAGGIYRASTADGSIPVILKEARPHAGLSPDGREARQRLYDEAKTLELLASESGVVKSRGIVEVDDHAFLVLDEVVGHTLNSEIAHRTPIVKADSTSVDYLEYRDWALGVVARVEAILDRIHAAGVSYGDLHPGNVVVTQDGDVTLIDFELARPASANAKTILAAPGFAPPPDRTGVNADQYSLACLKLFLFVPLTSLLALDAGKLDELINWADQSFLLPESYRESIRQVLTPVRPLRGSDCNGQVRRADLVRTRWETGTEDGLFGLQVYIARAIDDSADYSRPDRCFPGDIRQFSENGYGLAYGAAGVIHALSTAKVDVPAKSLEWLDDAAAASDSVGLYSGLAGAAWLLRRLGQDDDADKLAERIIGSAKATLAQSDSRPSVNLYSGLSGVGLYLLSEPGDAATELANRLFRVVRRHVLKLEGSATADSAPHGLMWGPSGAALFATRLYERSGEAEHLALAEKALDLDLARCIPAPDGSLQMDEGWRLMPYLASGSAGCALVAAQLAPHSARHGDRYLKAIQGIEPALRARFTIEPGLFHGRAGLVHVLAYLQRLGLASSKAENAIAAHVEAFSLHSLNFGTGISFPGTGLLRHSMDFATGSAGVLSALQAYSMLTFDDEQSGWDSLLPLLLRPIASTHHSDRIVLSKGVTTTHDGIPPQPAKA